MSAAPAPGTVLGRLDALEDSKGKVMHGGPGGTFVVRSGDEAFAWRNFCPHAGLPLAMPDGRVLVHQGQNIVCPVHGASFDVRSGACTGGPAAGDELTAVPVDVVNGEIIVR